MAFLFKRKYGGDGKQAARWYGEYRNEHGAAVRVPLSVNKATAQRLLNELVRKAELVAAGIVDHFEDARKTPLSAHLGEFEQSLKAKGRTEEYIALKVGRVQSVLDGCGWVYTRDIDPTRLEKFLHDLRAEAGRSTQTSNDWLQAVKQFVKWLRENGRLDRDPLAGLKGGNVRTDRRHIRRTLPTDQLAKLLDTARDSRQTFRGLGGDARYHAYVVALSTGFRLEEVAGLCPEDFDLTADPPRVRLAAIDTKNRQGANQPMPRQAAETMATYLAGKPVGLPIWPGTWGTRGADMLKLDLAAAGIPYSVQGPDGPEVFDFHALRATYITMLVQTGVTVKEAQVLARHSDPRLTLNVYTKLQMSDLAAAADRLPNLPAGPTRRPAELPPHRPLPDGVSNPPQRPALAPATGSPLTPRLTTRG